jgi:hypothetical protein
MRPRQSRFSHEIRNEAVYPGLEVGKSARYWQKRQKLCLLDKGNINNANFPRERRHRKSMTHPSVHVQIAPTYATRLALSLSHVLVRLDGLYGNAAPLADLLAPGGPGVVVRGKDYHLLDLPAVSARLQLPPDQQTRHLESQTSRALYDCPNIALTPTGPVVRMPPFCTSGCRRSSVYRHTA